MKFKTHLLTEKFSEKSDDVEILDFIKKNCKPFMRDLQRMNDIKGLFSGRFDRSPQFIKKVRKNRSPSDTPEEIQKMIDGFFKKKFGVKPRSNSVFVTGRSGTAVIYGLNVYLIIPIGKYEVYWSKKIKDLYTDVVEDKWVYEKSWGFDSIYEEEYGSGSDNGSWYSSITQENYRDDKQSIIDRIYSEVNTEYLQFLNIYDEDVDKWNDDHPDEEPPEQEYGYGDIDLDLEWEPEVSEEEFDQQREEEFNDDFKESIGDAVDTYTKGNLKGAIKSNSEIMLICDSYLALMYEPNITIKNHDDVEHFRQKSLVGNRILYYIIKNKGAVVGPKQQRIPFKK